MAETFNSTTVKNLQLISGLLDTLVELVAQGAGVNSKVVKEILYQLIFIVGEAIEHIEENADVHSIKDRSSTGSNVDIKG